MTAGGHSVRPVTENGPDPAPDLAGPASEGLPEISTNEAKYRTRNPLKRLLIANFVDLVCKEIASREPRTVLEAGCGEGFISDVIESASPGCRSVGLDIQRAALVRARGRGGGRPLLETSVLALPLPSKEFEMTVCLEVLEHVVRPFEALNELCRVTSGRLALSVPNEPWFRIASFLSFSYLRTWGNHPEHINHWSTGEFVEFVKPLVEVESVHSPFPWTFVVGKVR